jgi:hypothetical protein
MPQSRTILLPWAFMLSAPTWERHLVLAHELAHATLNHTESIQHIAQQQELDANARSVEILVRFFNVSLDEAIRYIIEGYRDLDPAAAAVSPIRRAP